MAASCWFGKLPFPASRCSSLDTPCSDREGCWLDEELTSRLNELAVRRLAAGSAERVGGDENRRLRLLDILCYSIGSAKGRRLVCENIVFIVLRYVIVSDNKTTTCYCFNGVSRKLLKLISLPLIFLEHFEITLILGGVSSGSKSLLIKCLGFIWRILKPVCQRSIPKVNRRLLPMTTNKDVVVGMIKFPMGRVPREIPGLTRYGYWVLAANRPLPPPRFF